MANVHIVVDSAAALPRGAAQDLALSVVTHGAVVDGRPFHGADLVDPVFFDALRSAETLPRVTPPSPDDFLDMFERVLGWGVEVVSLHPSRAISDSAAAARVAAASLPPEAPLSIVETAWCGSALGLIAVHAAQAGIDDSARGDILALVEVLGARLQLVGVSGEPAYLDRFGCLGPAQGSASVAPTAAHTGPDSSATASAARLIDARILFECRDGVVQPLKHLPDLGTALRQLVGEVAGRVDPSAALHLGLLSAGADAEAAAIATFLEGRLQPAEIWIAPCDPVLAALVGPGAFGVALYAG